MIFLTLLVAGAIAGLVTARILHRDPMAGIGAATGGSLGAFVAGGLWIALAAPRAGPLDLDTLAVGITGAITVAATLGRGQRYPR